MTNTPAPAVPWRALMWTVLPPVGALAAGIGAGAAGAASPEGGLPAVRKSLAAQPVTGVPATVSTLHQFRPSTA